MKSINVEAAWTVRGDGILVAVVDTGVDAGHPDLIGRVDIAHGYNAVLDQIVADTNDVIGHGTMVAGIIAAKENNSYGISGSCSSLNNTPIKVFADSGPGDWITVARGIRYAVVWLLRQKS